MKKIHIILSVSLIFLIVILVFIFVTKKENIDNNDIISVKNPIAECENISNLDYRLSCYVKYAVNRSDYSICDGIKNQHYKEGCYSEVSRVKPDINICKKIKQEEIYRENCYLYVAIANNDSSLCNSLETQRDKCFYGVGVRTKNIDLCNKIKDCRDNIICLAIATTNPDKCEEMCKTSNIFTDKYMCYLLIALTEKNATICEKLVPYERDKCYKSVESYNKSTSN